MTKGKDIDEMSPWAGICPVILNADGSEYKILKWRDKSTSIYEDVKKDIDPELYDIKGSPVDVESEIYGTGRMVMIRFPKFYLAKKRTARGIEIGISDTPKKTESFDVEDWHVHRAFYRKRDLLAEESDKLKYDEMDVVDFIYASPQPIGGTTTKHILQYGLVWMSSSNIDNANNDILNIGFTKSYFEFFDMILLLIMIQREYISIKNSENFSIQETAGCSLNKNITFYGLSGSLKDMDYCTHARFINRSDNDKLICLDYKKLSAIDGLFLFGVDEEADNDLINPYATNMFKNGDAWISYASKFTMFNPNLNYPRDGNSHIMY